jgi:oligoribonuclease NrnB/cAMP/cGMP phosphodiesterase (DHH superfamily)
MKKPILIYHKGCPDGFGAAFAFWLKFGNTMEYIPIYHSTERFYGIPAEDLIGRVIYMADIVFEREDMIFLMKYAEEIIADDHHKSAEQNCGDLECCHFDMAHSGAVLAWHRCHPDKEIPKMLKYIEDRDLNGPQGCSLPYAQELLLAIDSYEKKFEIWEDLARRLDEPDEVAQLLREGNAILRYNKVLMKKIIRSAYTADIKGYKVPILNTPFFRSEILAELAVGNPFSAGYHFNGEDFIISLRADGETPESVDVSEIALQFPGGGGHKNAAGFSIKNMRDLDEE